MTEPKRKNITVRLDHETWTEFRKKLIEEDKDIQGFFQGRVDEYLAEDKVEDKKEDQ